MEEFLQETFGPAMDFNVSVRADGQTPPYLHQLEKTGNEAEAKPDQKRSLDLLR